MAKPSGASEFDAMISYNFDNSPDVLINVAADDPRLREVTRWLLEDPEAPDPEDDCYYEEAADHVAETYGIDVEHVGEAMQRCADKVYREIVNG